MVTYYVGIERFGKGNLGIQYDSYSVPNINELRKKLMLVGKAYVFYIWNKKTHKYFGYLAYTEPQDTVGWIWYPSSEKCSYYVTKNGRLTHNKGTTYYPHRR